MEEKEIMEAKSLNDILSNVMFEISQKATDNEVLKVLGLLEKINNDFENFVLETDKIENNKLTNDLLGVTLAFKACIDRFIEINENKKIGVI